MILQDRLHRTGGLLSRRRRILPLAFVLAMAVALLFAAPFYLWTGIINTTLSCVVTLCGLYLRFISMRADVRDVESLMSDAGIYSLVRFPHYLASATIMLGLTIYCGIGWFLLIYIGVGALILERIMLFEDGVFSKRYGEEYIKWCAKTNAFFLPWRKIPSAPSQIKTSVLLRKESLLIFAVAIGYAIINVLKNLMIDFTLSIDYFTALIVLITAAFALICNLSRIVSGGK